MISSHQEMVLQVSPRSDDVLQLFVSYCSKQDRITCVTVYSVMLPWHTDLQGNT